jgi:hypothetical protein
MHLCVRRPCLTLILVQRDAIQFQPVIHQLEPQLAGDLGLQLLDLLGGELDHLAVAQVDQVIVVAVSMMPASSNSLTVRYTVEIEILSSTATQR